MNNLQIRRETSLKLYENLLVYGDKSGIPEENLDNVLSMLSEVNWEDIDIEKVREQRNILCDLMGVVPPKSKKGNF